MKSGASARARRPISVTRALLQRWRLPELDGKLGKEERGQVLVVGGSTRVPGAVMLAAEGALRAGGGRLQVATSRSVAPMVAVAMPEACVLPLAQTAQGELAARGHGAIRREIERCDALLVGPGMRDGGLCKALLGAWSGKSRAVMVVDGAALTAFEDDASLLAHHKPSAVLTPHPGEMAKLCGIPVEDVLRSPQQLAEEQARRLNVVVVLKGAATHIASPGGRTYLSTRGNMGLGTSGSGDALAGIITGLCARGADPLQAAVWGVYLHASAGEALARGMGGLGFLARELAPQVPKLLDALERPDASSARRRSRSKARRAR
jgi:ADP-dependent NAD(P)H-hydrate dehydratase